MPQQVREAMTPDPVEVGPDMPMREVARRMRDEAIEAVLVTEEGQLRGLVTDRDLTVCMLADGGDVSRRTMFEACSSQVLSVAPDDDVDRAFQLMQFKGVGFLPVIENGRAIGVIALSDINSAAPDA